MNESTRTSERKSMRNSERTALHRSSPLLKNNPSFLPTPTRDVEEPMVHYANADLTGALCGAPTFGVFTDLPLDCVVCAELRKGRKG